MSIFHTFFSVSIVDVEQVNISWNLSNSWNADVTAIRVDIYLIHIDSKDDDTRITSRNQRHIKDLPVTRDILKILPVPIPDEEKKSSYNFILTLCCLKRFYEGLRPFEAPQRSVKIKIQLNFYFNTTFRNAQDV